MDENGSSSNEPKNKRNLPVSVFFKDARYPYVLSINSSPLFYGGAESF